MQHIPDPEHAGESKSEVEITDLDSPPASGNVSGRHARWHRMSSFRVRVWMGIALIAAIALLIVTILVSILHQPEVAKKTLPPLPVNYPVSLSVADGICYANSATGVVTAIRASNGTVLWHHTSGKAGEGSITVVDGVIYLAPLLPSGSTASTVTIEALRASNGSQLWSRTLPTDAPSLFQFTVVNNIVYIQSDNGRIDALRASDGSLLWHYSSQVPVVSLPSIANGVAYVGTQDSHLSALRASDGSPLWTYRSPSPLEQFTLDAADGMIFLRLQNGGMDGLRASTGVLRWRYTPTTPALNLYPQLLVASGIIYVLTQDGHLFALRAGDGSTVWSIPLYATDILPPAIIAGGVIYVATLDGSITALREKSGSVLWRYQGKEGIPTSFTVAQGAIYLTFFATSGDNSTGNVTVLRPGDGSILWRYTPHVSAIQAIPLLPVVGDDLVLIALQDGSINALSSNSGSLLWHRAM